MKKQPIHAITLALLLTTTAGCVGATQAPTSPLVVQLHNDTDDPLSATFLVGEPHGGTTIYERDFSLKPGERVLVDAIELLQGPYNLTARTPSLGREATIDLDGSAQQYRFVILDDAIAFQVGP